MSSEDRGVLIRNLGLSGGCRKPVSSGIPAAVPHQPHGSLGRTFLGSWRLRETSEECGNFPDGSASFLPPSRSHPAQSLLASEPPIPGFRTPAEEWGLPGLGVPEPHAQIPRLHAGTRRSAHPPRGPARRSRARGLRRGVARDPADGRTGNGSGRRRDTPGIPGPHREQPSSSGLWEGCLSSRASSPAGPAPPRRASQSGGGSRLPARPIGGIQFCGHAPRGPKS